MTTTTSTITSPISTASRDRAVATLLLAFTTDPVIRWFLPEPSRYVTYFPDVVGLMAAPAVEAGTADITGDDAGAAVWVPPGASPDNDAVGELMVRAVDEGRHPEAFAFFEQMAEHHPTGAHWYLPFIGVEPTRQGRGLGSRLLDWGLARADRDGVPAYLEASSPRNRALYERHGFVATAEVQAGDSPPMWPMHRPARDAAK
jgi:GNAT superfamily N-acetyltransferase